MQYIWHSQHYVIKFVNDLRQVSGFLRVLRFPPPITDRHDITEILLKVALNKIKQTILCQMYCMFFLYLVVIAQVFWGSCNRPFAHCYWWRKPEDPEKTTDLSQVIDKLYHIMLYTLPWSRFKLTTLVVTGTDCISSHKSN
jgi:hypothetical protein